MSNGRIDVVTTPHNRGVTVSLEALERLDGMPTKVHPDHEQRFWFFGLTFEEARYLRDELAGALEKHPEAPRRHGQTPEPKTLEELFAEEQSPDQDEDDDPECGMEFGGCAECAPRFHQDGYINIGRGHWFFCLEHRVSWFAGSNLFSSWRDENEDEQRERYDRLDFGSFREVTPRNVTSGHVPTYDTDYRRTDG